MSLLESQQDGKVSCAVVSWDLSRNPFNLRSPCSYKDNIDYADPYCSDEVLN
jgi:hypothetical protein